MKKVDISTKKYPNTYAIVDDEDYERINQYKWYPQKIGKNIYACRREHITRNKGNYILMHRYILDYIGDSYVDHKDGDGLDNRKENLRLCTKNQNHYNSCVRSDNTSGYKGVYYHKGAKKWMAYITKDQKRIHLGLHKNKEDAAVAYNKAAEEYFGEFARLNVVGE